MDSIPEFYTDDYTTTTTTTTFLNDFCELLAPPSSLGTGGELWSEETLAPLFDDFGLHHQITNQYSFSDHKAQASAAAAIDPTSFSHQDMLALPQLNNNSMASSLCVINNDASGGSCQNLCFGSCQLVPDHNLYEFGDDSFSLVPEIKPLFPQLSSDNWEIRQSGELDTNMKVGRYSEEVRKERILRYLKKRNQRNFNKTIKYACRKTLADRRIRVRGRFARNNESCDQEQRPRLNYNPTKKKNNDDINSIIHKDDDHSHLLYNHDYVGLQMKKDEEEWLQEITSLMYLPYISS